MRTNRAIALSILLAGVSPPVLAQTDPASPAEAGGLSEIIVTAERRAQSLQDVPISATVLTGEELIKRGVTNLNDIQQVAPSIAINTFNRSTFINIRGVGIAQSAPTSNPGVAYYIDGQLIPHEQFIGHSFYDIGSIEVLRGPQGTLTGQNSTGGAIYVRTPEPRFNSNFAIGDLTVANFGRYRGVAAVNIGGENVALRVAYIHEERDSFTRNIAPNAQSQPGNLNMDAVRANLRLEGMDGRLRVNVRGEYFDVRSDNNAVKNRSDLGQPGPIGDPFVISEDARSYQDQVGYRLSTELGYDISDGIAFRGLVSWQDGSTRDQTDGDRSSTALPVPVGSPTNGTNTRNFPGRVSNAVTVFETLIGEVNLLSTGSGPFQWVVGGFYMDEAVPVSLLRDNRSTLDFVSSNSNIIATAYNSSRSIFGQANWFVTPQIELIAGGRYSWDKQVYTRFALPGPPLAAPFTSDQSSNTFTYKLGVNYHAGENTLLYATASKGFKAGGVNLDPSLGIFGPESNYVYELGFKSQFLDNRIRVNGALFYSDYRDIQLASLVAVGPALLPQTQNAAKGKAWGGELEVTAQFGGFGANLGIGYLDAQFSGDDICINNTNAPVGDFPAPTPNPCTAGNSYIPNGAVLPFSPAWTVNAGVQYTFEVGDIAITPRIQWSHLAEQYATPFPSPITRVPGRDLFDARITFDIGEKYSIEGFVNNLTNETYIATQIQNSSSADGGIIFGAPRTFGVRLKSRSAIEGGRRETMKRWWISLAILPLAALGAMAAGATDEAAQRWWSPGEGRTFPERLDYTNEHGTLRLLLTGGPFDTRGHPFFEPLGANGRACVTCHQPADSMSLSAATARERWTATAGKDPLFASLDGSNCPTLPHGERASHSLLLERGLFRIQRPWPVREWNGREATPDFTIEVVRDPTGCNSGPKYGPAAGNISVYRRPRPLANMKYLLAVGFPFDPKQGLSLPLDPDTGQPMSGNLMADNRAGNLRLQMDDASTTHLEFERLTPAQVTRITEFEKRIFAAQQVSKVGGAVDTHGAKGGPAQLRDSEPGQLGSIGQPVWSEFAAWEKISPAEAAKLTPEQLAFRQSVARGAKTFRDKTFLITDSAGINSPMGFGNPVRNSCVFCHNMTQMGNDVAPGQVDLGTTTLPFADPMPDLPLFKVTCLMQPHPHYGPVIYTMDPGFALTTGRCADVGKITLQSMRGLAARAPYFSNGLAKDLRGVIDYYERRYSIGYTEQEKQDLINLMSVL